LAGNLQPARGFGLVALRELDGAPEKFLLYGLKHPRVNIDVGAAFRLVQEVVHQRL
jgi:hypothetical protein